MKLPGIRYARNGNARIAYQVVGQGALDVVYIPGLISNLDAHWEEPGFAHFLRRLSAFSRLIQIDPRGAGLSDRGDPDDIASPEQRMEDVRAVMDACGSGRAAVLGVSEGAPVALLFAAMHPDRVRALTVCGGYASFRRWVLRGDELTRFIQLVDREWGSGASLSAMAPGRAADPHFADWWARFERLSSSPTGAAALIRMYADDDVRSVLGLIRAPTLVIHRSRDVWVSPDAGRHLAARIKGARLLELSGRDHPIWASEVDVAADAIEEFLTGMPPRLEGPRTLAALLVVRLRAPARPGRRLLDGEWLERASAFAVQAEAVARRHDGRIEHWEAETGLLRFEGTAGAAQCAVRLNELAQGQGLALAQGLHAGEVHLARGIAAGLAVRVTEAIANRAKSGETLVSDLAAELSAGSGIHFDPKEPLAVEGLERLVHVSSLIAVQHLAPRPALATSDTSDLGRLSTREREVLALLAEGLGNAAIAFRLDLSEHTVKRHVANILTKLDLPTRVAAAMMLVRQART